MNLLLLLFFDRAYNDYHCLYKKVPMFKIGSVG